MSREPCKAQRHLLTSHPCLRQCMFLFMFMPVNHQHAILGSAVRSGFDDVAKGAGRLYSTFRLDGKWITGMCRCMSCRRRISRCTPGFHLNHSAKACPGGQCRLSAWFMQGSLLKDPRTESKLCVVLSGDDRLLKHSRSVFIWKFRRHLFLLAKYLRIAAESSANIPKSSSRLCTPHVNPAVNPKEYLDLSKHINSAYSASVTGVLNKYYLRGNHMPTLHISCV
jgi:hypothetical protein